MNNNQHNNQYNNNNNNNNNNHNNYYDNLVNSYYVTPSNTQSGIVNLGRNPANTIGISNNNHPIDNNNSNNSARQNLINNMNIGSQGLIRPTSFTNNHLDSNNMDIINNNNFFGVN